MCEAEKEGSQAQGLPKVQSDFKATLGNLTRSCFKIKSVCGGGRGQELVSSVKYLPICIKLWIRPPE